MSYEVTGKLIATFDPKTFGSGSSKREFAIEIPHEKYPQQVKLEIWGDKAAALDKYPIGSSITVHFDLSGREYARKDGGGVDYFTSLKAWKLEAVPGQAQPRARSRPRIEDEDDLPF